MSTISIDNVEYETESMSDEAVANLKSIQFVDGELARLNAQVSVMTTARIAYASALQRELNSEPDATEVEVL